jgi:hypothetical protein
MNETDHHLRLTNVLGDTILMVTGPTIAQTERHQATTMETVEVVEVVEVGTVAAAGLDELRPYR